MTENRLKNFELLIMNCETLIQNSKFDIIEWNESFNREKWEKTSFYNTNELKKGRRFWEEHKQDYYKLFNQTRNDLQTLIIFEGNENVKRICLHELKRLYSFIDKFRKDYNLNHYKIMSLNRWFWVFYNELSVFIKWWIEQIEGNYSFSDIYTDGKTKSSVLWQSFELLKVTRLSYINEEIDSLIKESNKKQTHLNDLELQELRKGYIENEIKIVDIWLKDSKDSICDVVFKRTELDKIEINKYKIFLQETLIEIEKSKNVICFNSDKKENQNPDFNFQNNFDNVDSFIVYSFFKSHLVDTKIISDDILKKFLEISFQDKKIPSKKFDLSMNFKKSKIESIFYKYYVEIASKPYGKSKMYCALLGDYFNGFLTENISTNWSKNYKKPK